MNIDELKKRINKPTAFEWQGERVWLRKIGAADGMALFGKIKALASAPLDSDSDREATLNFHAEAIAKSWSDEAGVLQFDSPEGIEALKQVNFTELIELGELVLRHSGFKGDEGAKKNSVPNNLPPTDSVVSLDIGPTLISSSLT
jgi:hypothetical protein